MSYSNVLATGRIGRQYVRLLAGSPLRNKVVDKVTLLQFGKGDVFAYLVMNETQQLSAVVVNNKPGRNQCAALRHGAQVMLEVHGKRGVRRLLHLLKALKALHIPLDTVSEVEWVQLDCLLAARKFQPELIDKLLS